MINCVEKIKELRNRIPVPIHEADRLLEKYGGDMNLCEIEFRNRNITEICHQTGCSEEVAGRCYSEWKYDTAKAIKYIKDEMYDRQYIQPGYLTYEKLCSIYQWLEIECLENMETALSSEMTWTVIDVLSHMGNLSHIHAALVTAKSRHDIFLKKDDSQDVRMYIRQANQLRSDDLYRNSREVFELSLETFEEELDKHFRNIRTNHRE